METIRNYLNAMFAGLPDTPEVRRAYEELAEMMEDKYTEMIAEGSSEQEAIGTVISEFGNLEELAQTLGIEDCVSANTAGAQRTASTSQSFGEAGQSAGQQSVESAGPLRFGESEQSTAQQSFEEAGQSSTQSSTQSSAQSSTQSSTQSSAQSSEQERHLITEDEVCEYLGAGYFSTFLKAAGVFLCIVSPSGAILLGDLGYSWIAEVFSSIGISLFFVCIAAAIACFILSGSVMKPWQFIKTDPCVLDDTARAIADDQSKKLEERGLTQKILGIVLCIISPVPMILFQSEFGAALFFVFVGAGVGMLVLLGLRGSLFKKLDKAEERAARTAKRYVSVEKESKGKEKKGEENEYYYEDRNLQSVMAVYWPLVTCVYLGFSFLTGTWALSWMIFIIAGVVKKYIENRYGQRVVQ